MSLEGELYVCAGEVLRVGCVRDCQRSFRKKTSSDGWPSLDGATPTFGFDGWSSAVRGNAGNLIDLLNMHAQSIWDSARSLIESSEQTHGFSARLYIAPESAGNNNATRAHSNSSLVAFCARSLSLSSEYYEKYIFFSVQHGKCIRDRPLERKNTRK